MARDTEPFNVERLRIIAVRGFDWASCAAARTLGASNHPAGLNGIGHGTGATRHCEHTPPIRRDPPATTGPTGLRFIPRRLLAPNVGGLHIPPTFGRIAPGALLALVQVPVRHGGVRVELRERLEGATLEAGFHRVTRSEGYLVIGDARRAGGALAPKGHQPI
jgi:hypothetical protein